jgi:putative oxidoreductase
MNAFITVFYDWSRAVASYFTWLAPLAVRITVGVVFMGTGWTKLQNLPGITRNFASLGIPAPEILTPFVSGIEFVVPLMIVMVVAIVSAKLGDVDGLETFLGFEEVSYFVMFAWLAVAGPGPVSIDHVILKASGRDPAAHGS